jgi:hypothetical protein
MEAAKEIVRNSHFSNEANEAGAFLAGITKLDVFQIFEIPLQKIKDVVEILFQNALSRPPPAHSGAQNLLFEGIRSVEYLLKYKYPDLESTRVALIKCDAIRRWSLGFRLPDDIRVEFRIL